MADNRIYDASEDLVNVVRDSKNFLLASFTFSQQFVQAGRTALERELSLAQKAAQ